MPIFDLPEDDEQPAGTTGRAGGWPKGRPRSDETKAKIRATMTGRQRSEETKARIRAAKQYGLRDRVSQLQEELDQIREELSRRPDLKPTKAQNRARAAAVMGHEYPEDARWR